MSETEELAEFVVRTTYDDFPNDAVEKAKLAIRDYVGVAIHGSGQEIGDIVTEYVECTSPGDTATVVGRSSASPVGAALANGTFGHAIDYDDTFETAVIHPTSPIFSAALAAGETVDATTRDALTGYVVGAEVAYNIEQAISPPHYQNGWHSTGTTGSFGATAAVGSVLGLDADEIQRAFGVVASASSSIRKNFGSMTKPLHAGHAAQMGLRAGLLSRAGFTADERIFEGDLGYGSVMVPDDGYDPTALTEGLRDEEWAVTDIAFKPFPSGALTHAPMEALLRLVEREDLSPDDVESITVMVDDSTEGVLLHEAPSDALQAKFSLEYCLALILCERRATIREFTDDYVDSPHIRSELTKVERQYLEELFEGDYDRRACRLRVTLTDGTTFEEAERFTPGGPTNPIADERLERKFYRCVESVADTETGDEIHEAIENLHEERPIASLTAHL
jgi:2-methylcitrate dehydratase PrpD